MDRDSADVERDSLGSRLEHEFEVRKEEFERKLRERHEKRKEYGFKRKAQKIGYGAGVIFSLLFCIYGGICKPKQYEKIITGGVGVALFAAAYINRKK